MFFSLLYFSYKNLKDANSTSSHINADISSRFFAFPQNIKSGGGVARGGPNYLGQTNSACPHLSYLVSCLVFQDPNSSSLIRLQCILHDSAVLLSVFEEFFKLKRGHIISWREPILQNSWIIWCLVLYYNIKYLKDPNSLSFIRFQSILHDSAVLLLVFENSLKVKWRDIISWGEAILQNGWIIWPSPMYFNIKHLKDPNSL